MSLIPCPQCGHQVSDQATACPHCGRLVQKSSMQFREPTHDSVPPPPPLPAQVNGAGRGILFVGIAVCCLGGVSLAVLLGLSPATIEQDVGPEDQRAQRQGKSQAEADAGSQRMAIRLQQRDALVAMGYTPEQANKLVLQMQQADQAKPTAPPPAPAPQPAPAPAAVKPPSTAMAQQLGAGAASVAKPPPPALPQQLGAGAASVAKPPASPLPSPAPAPAAMPSVPTPPTPPPAAMPKAPGAPQAPAAPSVPKPQSQQFDTSGFTENARKHFGVLCGEHVAAALRNMSGAIEQAQAPEKVVDWFGRGMQDDPLASPDTSASLSPVRQLLEYIEQRVKAVKESLSSRYGGVPDIYPPPKEPSAADVMRRYSQLNPQGRRVPADLNTGSEGS